VNSIIGVLFIEWFVLKYGFTAYNYCWVEGNIRKNSAFSWFRFVI